jgi:hypothetical protein
MGTIVANPYYDDPFLSSIASNISRAFIDRNPGQTAAGRAHARLYGLQADELERKAKGQASIGQLFLVPAGPNGTYTPEQVQQMTSAGVSSGYDPSALSKYFLFNSSNAGHPTSVVQRAFTGAGHALGDNQSVTTEQHDSNLTRDENTRKSVAGIAAGPGYAAVAQRDRAHKDEMDFKERTRWDKPVEVNQGAAVYPNPDDKRMPGVAPGTIPAPKPPTADRYVVSKNPDGSFSYRPVQDGLPAPTPSSERPTADRYVQTEDPNKPGSNIYVPVAPGVPGPAVKSPAPIDVNPKEIDELVTYALKDSGVVDGDWKVDSQFTEQFGSKLPAARAAASATYQRTRDAEAGKRAFWEALGVPPGSKWVSNGSIARSFGYSSRFEPPNGSPVQGAVTGGGSPAPLRTPAAPAQSAPVSVPPPAQRVPGQTYMTPKGAFVWTGTGWAAPSNVR